LNNKSQVKGISNGTFHT